MSGEARDVDRVPVLMDRITTGALWCALVPVLLWSSVSVTLLTLDADVPVWMAWIPAFALDGAMIAATRVWLLARLDRGIRLYAAFIAVLGYCGSITAGAAEHGLRAAGVDAPVWAAVVLGGLPALMAGMLVHVMVRIAAQRVRAERGSGEHRTAVATEQGSSPLVSSAHRSLEPEQPTEISPDVAEVTASEHDSDSDPFMISGEDFREEAPLVQFGVEPPPAYRSGTNGHTNGHQRRDSNGKFKAVVN